MKLSLKIAHKGLVLVAVPLIFQIVFISLLAILVSNAESQMRKEAEARAIVSHMNNLSRMTEDATIALVRYHSSENQRDLQEYDRIVAQTPEEFAALRHLMADKPKDLETVEQLETITNKALELLAKYKVTLATESHMAALVYVPTLAKLGLSARNRIETIITPYKEAEDFSLRRQEEYRTYIKQFLIQGIALELAMALVLGFYFKRDITSRLKQVEDNSSRLAAGKPLIDRMDGGDEISNVDSVFHDMADTLRAAAEREREIEALKREFVAMVSHDLRTPLTALQNTLALISDGIYGQLNETGLKRVETAEQSADRLIKLINDLLDVEKLELGKMVLQRETVPIERVVMRAVEDVRGFAEQHGVTIKTEPCTAEVFCDQDRLVQVLVNLLSNAVKFSEAGSSVLVQMGSDNRAAEVRVKDAGRGIPAHLQSSVFERFKQVKASDGKTGKGTGLGLAICKAIIESHDGTIGVESKEGSGSTFWFRIPSRAAAAGVPQLSKSVEA